MLHSRRAILRAGFYDPIATATNAAVLHAMSGRGAAHIADLGCGEGYYLDSVKRHLAAKADVQHHYYGVDISRAGIKMATSYDRTITWIVASLHDSPFAAQSLDVVLCMFAPIDVPDVRRVLRQDGALITVTPGPDHLDALRAIIYPSVVPHPSTPALMAGDDYFHLSSSSRVQFAIAATSHEQIMNLLAMTPYYWNISRETKALVEARSRLDLTVDAYVNTYRARAISIG
jgi:23S rRNA (guanine745-N1)-methyltransferase